jgi:hypothetical protein
MSRIEQQDSERADNFKPTSKGAFTDAYSPSALNSSGETNRQEGGVNGNGDLDFKQIDSNTLQDALSQYNRSAAGLAASEFTNQYDASSLFNGSNDASSIYQNGMSAASIINDGTSSSGSQSSANSNERGISTGTGTGTDPTSPIYNCTAEPVGGTEPGFPISACAMPVEPPVKDPGFPISACAMPVEPPVKDPGFPISACAMPVEPPVKDPGFPISACAMPVEPPVGIQPNPPIESCVVVTNPQPVTDPFSPGGHIQA